MTARTIFPVEDGWARAVLYALAPLLHADEVAWQDQALCSQVDPEIFFPEKGGSTREAKVVCRSCEVRAECLEYALDHDERFGIYGGYSERERRHMKRVKPKPEQVKPRPAPRPQASQFTSVWRKGVRWSARVTLPDGTRKHLGSFDREIDAARAVTEARGETFNMNGAAA